MQRRLLHKHTTSECHNRIVQCEYCEEQFAFWATEVRLLNIIKIIALAYLYLFIDLLTY